MQPFQINKGIHSSEPTAKEQITEKGILGMFSEHYSQTDILTVNMVDYSILARSSMTFF